MFKKIRTEDVKSAEQLVNYKLLDENLIKEIVIRQNPKLTIGL